ncbi:MAG: hypothetical protein MZV70_55605 [Desulfobacterales bacterium]|nr:hypothetical protein [Desulfobacterales bacterium]
MTRPVLLEMTEAGLHCPAGGFYIDPRRPVERAVITHAHADHARPGCGSYLATPECALPDPGPPRPRRPRPRNCLTVARSTLDGVRLSLHPAGHILGLRPGADRTPGRGLGGHRRLQAPPRSHLRARSSRCAATP